MNKQFKRIRVESDAGQDRDFKPDVEWMRRKYEEFNRTLFKGVLGPCDFGIFTSGEGRVLGLFTMNMPVWRRRGDRRMAVKSANGQVTFINRDNFDLCRPTIKLNGNYRGLESGFENTLVHEMCHYYTYMDGKEPKQAHGVEFRAAAAIVAIASNNRFNITTNKSAEEVAANYTLDAETAAKKERRENGRRTNTAALFMFFKGGEIKLCIAKDNKVLSGMIWHAKTMPGFDKAILSRNEDVVEFLFKHGYDRIFRTVRWWSNLDRHPWIGQIVDLITDPANQGAHMVAEAMDDDFVLIPPGTNLSVGTSSESELNETNYGMIMKKINENQKVTLTLRQLRRLVRESVSDIDDGMTVGQFLKSVKDIYAKYFPDSNCRATLSRGLGKAITIDCYLAKNRSECANGYWENDMFKVNFWIHNLPDSAEEDSPMPKTISLTSDAHSFVVAPDNKYNYYSSQRVPYRETIGAPEKCLQAFERFVKKLYDAVKEAHLNGKTAEDFIDLLDKKIG